MDINMAEEKKQEQQVVEEIVEEEINENPHKWTFLKYIKSIARFKFWVIGFTLFGAVAGYLGFRFILNPMKKTLTATYTYNLAGEYIDADTIRFIDGTLFSPYELSNKENLEKIKASNEKYASINVDKLVADNAIVISKNVTFLNERDTSDNIEVKYIISAKAQNFKTNELGKDFLYDVIHSAKDLSTTAINNYDTVSYFTDNFSTITFEKEINQLSDQYDQNNLTYTELITDFGGSTIGNSSGSKIYDLQNEYVANYYTSSVQSFLEELKSTLKNKKYVNYIEGQESVAINNIKIQCENYIQSIEDNNRKVAIYQDALTNLLSTTTEYRDDIAKEIASLTERITNIKLEIDELEDELEDSGYFLDKDPGSPTYGKYVLDEGNQDSTIYKLEHLSDEWVDGCKAFKNLISNYKSSLELDRQKVTTVYQYCYSQYQNKISIQNGGYIALTGAINEWIGAAAGLVVGFILTSIVTAIIYVYKEEK